MAEPRIGWGVLRVEMGRPVRRLMHWSKQQMMVAWTQVVSVEMEVIPRYVLERNSRGLAGGLGTRGEGYWRGGHGRLPHFCLGNWVDGAVICCSGEAGWWAFRSRSLLHLGRRPTDSCTEPLPSSIHGPRPPFNPGPREGTHWADPQNSSVSVVWCLVCMKL